MTKPKTFVVLGVPRSGTSMVAGMMRILGAYMGERIKPNKHEDLDFLWRDAAHIKKTIAKRNAERAVWGWKDPNCGRYLREVLPLLRNPRFIYVRRAARDAVRSDLARNGNAREGGVLRRNARLSRVYDETARAYPCLALRYERVIEDPIDAGAKMAEFLNVDYGEGAKSKIRVFVTPGDYRRLDE